MKRQTAKGLLRLWIAFGSILVFVVAVYVYNKPRPSSFGPGRSLGTYDDEGILIVVVGAIVITVGAFLLRWVLKAFTNDDQ